MVQGDVSNTWCCVSWAGGALGGSGEAVEDGSRLARARRGDAGVAGNLDVLPKVFPCRAHYPAIIPPQYGTCNIRPPASTPCQPARRRHIAAHLGSHDAESTEAR